MGIFSNEIKRFSKENWWVYMLLFVALTTIYITGKGNIIEIFLIILLNFVGILLIMMMQGSYTAKKNKQGSIFYLVATIIFIMIGLYGLLFRDVSQYIIWQTAYGLAAIKSFLYYNYSKDIKILNEKSFVFLNIILFTIFLKYFNSHPYAILQAIGFSIITTGLVSTNDAFRYWLHTIGITALISGSGWGVATTFIKGNTDGIALGFFILTMTVFIYYLKLIKKYI